VTFSIGQLVSSKKVKSGALPNYHRCGFRPSVLPASLIHRCRATEGCEDCLTLATVVSNSNEDSEQRQTKVHWEDI